MSATFYIGYILGSSLTYRRIAGLLFDRYGINIPEDWKMEKSLYEVKYAVALAEANVYKAMKGLDTSKPIHASLWHKLNNIDNLLIKLRADLNDDW